MDRSAEDFFKTLSEGLLAVVVKHAGAQQISERGVQPVKPNIRFRRIGAVALRGAGGAG